MKFDTATLQKFKLLVPFFTGVFHCQMSSFKKKYPKTTKIAFLFTKFPGVTNHCFGQN